MRETTSNSGNGSLKQRILFTVITSIAGLAALGLATTSDFLEDDSISRLDTISHAPVAVLQKSVKEWTKFEGDNDEKEQLLLVEEFGSQKRFDEISLDARSRARSMSKEERNEDPFVALCLIGNARTFTNPSVYWRLKHNLIDSLSKNTYVFAHIKTWDTDVKKQKDFGMFKPIPVSEKDLLLPINVLCPSFATVETARKIDPKELINTKCEFKKEYAKKVRQPDFFTNPENTPRFLAIMNSLNNCYNTILRFEETANIKFDAVAKSRPDAVFFFPSFTAQELLLRGDLVTHFSDLFVFSPRRFSDGFSRWWDNYTSCDGPWYHAYFPEDALRKGFEDLGAFYYYDRKTPISVRRSSKNETSATWLCRDQRRISLESCLSTVYDVNEEQYLAVSNSSVAASCP